MIVHILLKIMDLGKTSIMAKLTFVNLAHSCNRILRFTKILNKLAEEKSKHSHSIRKLCMSGLTHS